MALLQPCDAVIGFLRDDYQLEVSHEGRCILQMLVEYTDELKGTLSVMHNIFCSPPACNQEPLRVDRVPLPSNRWSTRKTHGRFYMGRVKKFAKFMRVRLKTIVRS